ncbi:MAG: hypothetical protein ACQETH_17465 [Candidatus Rifleibacteriota bacterium]
MKKRIFLTLMAVILLFSASVRGDEIQTLKELDQQFIQAAESELSIGVTKEKELKKKEAEIFNKLLKSTEKIDKFIEVADDFDSGMQNRFFDRLSFEVNQENRSDLKAYIDSWDFNSPSSGANFRSKQVIAHIYGHEVNLRDGEWRHTPDGRRFWVSNQYPDIVLSPAEYRHYSKNATVIDR